MKKPSWKNTLPLVLSLAAIGLDQLTKYLAVVFLKPIGTLPLIEGVLHFTYATNTGSAFSLFSGFTEVLSVVTFLVILVMLFGIVVNYLGSTFMNWCLAAIVGGGIGNLIDRVARGYVVDFIDFRLIHFAIFNVADIFVVVGVILLLIYLLFFESKRAKAQKDNQTEV